MLCLFSGSKIKAIEARTGLKLQALPKGARHEVGKTYYDSYWGQTYTVLAIITGVPIWGEMYKCRWQDGRINSHSTRLDPAMDYLVLEDDVKC